MVDEIVKLAGLLNTALLLEDDTVKLINIVLREKLEAYRKPPDEPVVIPTAGGDVVLSRDVFQEWTEGIKPLPDKQGGG